MGWGYNFRPYVPVARRQAQARRYGAQVAKQRGAPLAPVVIEGRKITSTFWGNAWCDNLERYSDFANRLPRGRTYVRNGSVIDMQIQRGEITALVSGSDVYHIKIKIAALTPSHWNRVRHDCASSIESLMDLWQGRLSQGVMQRLTRQKEGLFPQPTEIKLSCSCPDGAWLCKHVAAVLYGVGSRLDSQPELLFTLRGVDHRELVQEAITNAHLSQDVSPRAEDSLQGTNLGELFGIDLDEAAPSSGSRSSVPARRTRRADAAHVRAKKKKGRNRSASVNKKSNQSTKESAKETTQKALPKRKAALKKSAKKTARKSAKTSAKKTAEKSATTSAKKVHPKSPRKTARASNGKPPRSTAEQRSRSTPVVSVKKKGRARRKTAAHKQATALL